MYRVAHELGTFNAILLDCIFIFFIVYVRNSLEEQQRNKICTIRCLLNVSIKNTRCGVEFLEQILRCGLFRACLYRFLCALALLIRRAQKLVTSRTVYLISLLGSDSIRGFVSSDLNLGRILILKIGQYLEESIIKEGQRVRANIGRNTIISLRYTSGNSGKCITVSSD